jgi:hypothetical protein
MPLMPYYFAGIPGLDRTLFLFWLLGYAALFVLRSAKIDNQASIPSLFAGIGLITYWAQHRAEHDYDLANYPTLARGFLAIIIHAGDKLVRPRCAGGSAHSWSRRLFVLPFSYPLTVVKVALALLPLSR